MPQTGPSHALSFHQVLLNLGVFQTSLRYGQILYHHEKIILLSHRHGLNDETQQVHPQTGINYLTKVKKELEPMMRLVWEKLSN